MTTWYPGKYYTKRGFVCKAMTGMRLGINYEIVEFDSLAKDKMPCKTYTIKAIVHNEERRRSGFKSFSSAASYIETHNVDEIFGEEEAT